MSKRKFEFAAKNAQAIAWSENKVWPSTRVYILQSNLIEWDWGGIPLIVRELDLKKEAKKWRPSYKPSKSLYLKILVFLSLHRNQMRAKPTSTGESLSSSIYQNQKYNTHHSSNVFCDNTFQLHHSKHLCPQTPSHMQIKDHIIHSLATLRQRMQRSELKLWSPLLWIVIGVQYFICHCAEALTLRH